MASTSASCSRCGAPQYARSRSHSSSRYSCVLPQEAVKSGAVPQSRIDDMVRRMLIPMYALGLMDNPPKGMVWQGYLVGFI